MPNSAPTPNERASRVAGRSECLRRRDRWNRGVLSRWLQGVLVLVAIVPCFLIGGLASFSGERHWTRWLDRLSGNISLGKASSSRSPAVWKGDGVADFGRIKLLDYDPVTRVSTAVQFKMEAVTVFPEKQQFDAFMTRLGHTIQDELLVTVRSSTAAERRNEDYLGKKVVTRVNRLLGRQVLREVRITDLSISEFTSSENERPEGS